MKLSQVILNVRRPQGIAQFYHHYLGMHMTRGDGYWLVGYGGSGAQIELRTSTSDHTYEHHDTDLYWKVGITLPDVDVAYAQLRDAGVAVTEPSQFRDIGYMCHLTDPEGFQIELLQHTFQGVRSTIGVDANLPLGGSAQLGQITLRVSNINKALEKYRDDLGMRLLSIQKVPDLGFTLYFLAFTDETPPVANLEAVANREWLWQRPYTTLELQHVHNKVIVDKACHHDLGFHGLSIESATGTRTIL